MNTMISNLIILSVLILTAIPAFADWISMDDMAESDRILLHSVGLISQPSTLEGAHSHGQIGGTIGIGIRRPSSTIDAEERSSPADAASMDALQIHVVKGLSGSVDLGFSFSHVQSTGGNALAAYLQWTLFEGFQMPSIAVRGGVSKTFGYEYVDISGAAAEVLAGYDLFQFLGFYLGFGASSNVAGVDIMDNGSRFSLVRSSEMVVETVRAKTDWNGQHYLIGLTIKPWPPFLALGLEYLKNDIDMQTISLKASIGM
jgi:hypothetical protein